MIVPAASDKRFVVHGCGACHVVEHQGVLYGVLLSKFSLRQQLVDASLLSGGPRVLLCSHLRLQGSLCISYFICSFSLVRQKQSLIYKRDQCNKVAELIQQSRRMISHFQYICSHRRNSKNKMEGNALINERSLPLPSPHRPLPLHCGGVSAA